LSGLHVLDQLHEVLSINLVPESFLPGIKLVLNEGDHIPHVLEEDQFGSAIFELLVGRLLDIEKDFEIIELRSLFFKDLSLLIVQFNLSVRGCYCCLIRLLNIVWAFILEVQSEFSDLDLELPKSVLNVGCLFGLEWENLFFNSTKSIL